MLLTGPALRKVGLLTEDYFLNFDEQTGAIERARPGMTSYYAPTSIILTKARHGRFFAWRGALWELRQALMLTQENGRSSLRHRSFLLYGIVLAIRDFCLGRFWWLPSDGA